MSSKVIYGLLSGSELADFFIFCLYTCVLPHFCACPKPGPAFPSNVMVFLCSVSSVKNLFPKNTKRQFSVKSRIYRKTTSISFIVSLFQKHPYFIVIVYLGKQQTTKIPTTLKKKFSKNAHVNKIYDFLMTFTVIENEFLFPIINIILVSHGK